MSANDILILIVFVVGVGYGFFIGRAKVISLMIAAYVGFFVAQVAVPQLLDFLATKKVNAPDNALVGLVALVLVILYFQFKSGLSTASEAGRGVVGLAVTGVYAFLTTGLIADGVMRLLPDSQQATLVNNSKFIGQMMDYHLLWLLAPLGLWMVLSFLKRFG